MVKRHANVEGNLYVDNDAQWSLGTSRPLYIVPNSKCLNCKGGRFVPRDQNVPFISSMGLLKLQQNFGIYPRVIIEALLDEWPSQSHDARGRR